MGELENGILVKPPEGNSVAQVSGCVCVVSFFLIREPGENLRALLGLRTTNRALERSKFARRVAGTSAAGQHLATGGIRGADNVRIATALEASSV